MMMGNGAMHVRHGDSRHWAGTHVLALALAAAEAELPEAAALALALAEQVTAAQHRHWTSVIPDSRYGGSWCAPGRA